MPKRFASRCGLTQARLDALETHDLLHRHNRKGIKIRRYKRQFWVFRMIFGDGVGVPSSAELRRICECCLGGAASQIATLAGTETADTTSALSDSIFWGRKVNLGFAMCGTPFQLHVLVAYLNAVVIFSAGRPLLVDLRFCGLICCFFFCLVLFVSFGIVMAPDCTTGLPLGRSFLVHLLTKMERNFELHYFLCHMQTAC